MRYLSEIRTSVLIDRGIDSIIRPDRISVDDESKLKRNESNLKLSRWRSKQGNRSVRVALELGRFCW